MDRQVETTTSVRKFNGVGVIGPGCSLVALSRRDGRHRDAPHLVTLPVEARQLGEENVVLTVTLSEMRGNGANAPLAYRTVPGTESVSHERGFVLPRHAGYL